MMIKNIISLSRDAGSAIMQIYNGEKPLILNHKPDGSPITTADLAAHRIISIGLSELTPGIPLLSEEDPPDWSIRQNWRIFWLVDPLDGTKEFLRRSGEFTVNIALIENGKPIMGVVYAPVINKFYTAVNGKACCINTSGEQYIIAAKDVSPPLVAISYSQRENMKLQDYLIKLGKYQTITIGSSLKFCLVAEGKAQVYPRFGPTNVWDTAAGQAVATAAGAQVNDWRGQELNYIPRRSFLNPDFQVLAQSKDQRY